MSPKNTPKPDAEARSQEIALFRYGLIADLLAAVRAKQVGAGLTICLINDPTLIPLMEPLDIDAYINPRATTVSSILRHIRHGKVRAIYSLGDAEAEMIEAQVLSTSPLAGRMIRDIEFPEGVLVGALMKGDKVVGITTAASVWITAAIGITAGVGMYIIAGVVTLITFLVLMLPRVKG